MPLHPARAAATAIPSMHFPNFMVFLFCVLEITVDFIDGNPPRNDRKGMFFENPANDFDQSKPSPKQKERLPPTAARAHPPAA
jgi:hypothetical protein